MHLISFWLLYVFELTKAFHYLHSHTSLTWHTELCCCALTVGEHF